MEVGTVPRRGLIYLALAVLISVAAEIASKLTGPGFQFFDYLVAAASILSWIFGVYVATALMIEQRPSMAGFGKYALTGLAIAVPFLVCVGGLVGTAALGLGAGAVVFGLMIFPALLPIFLLPGWPIWQATSDRFIGPLEAWRSTRGFRLPLFISAFIASAFNRLVPAGSSSDDLSGTIMLACLGALAGLATAMIGMGVAVTSSRLMRAERA